MCMLLKTFAIKSNPATISLHKNLSANSYPMIARYWLNNYLLYIIVSNVTSIS